MIPENRCCTHKNSNNCQCFKHYLALLTVLDALGTELLVFRVCLVPKTVLMVSVDSVGSSWVVTVCLFFSFGCMAQG